MNRRQFLLGAGALALSGAAAGKWWPEQGFKNACLSDLPHDPAVAELLARTWEGLDPAQVWDSHAHLVGVGDSASGIWVNPRMDSLFNPMQYVQKLFFLNAGCVHKAPGQVDQSYVERLHNLTDAMPAGAKLLLLAFDAYVDSQGQPDLAHSNFITPNAYARQVAHERPERFEWAASIHPYRSDCVERLTAAARDGARAVKWLPAAQGIDPASPRCDGFYQALVRLQLPLISHAGKEAAVHAAELQHCGNPLRLRRPLEQGVRVVVAHCASHGLDRDLDQGADGPQVPSMDLFARLMNEPAFDGRLFADISALTQVNRAGALQRVLAQSDWHGRLLNGSDYPLPGVMPLISVEKIAAMGLLAKADIKPLQSLRSHNPLLFDLALKRSLRLAGQGLPRTIFETRPFFGPQPGGKPATA